MMIYCDVCIFSRRWGIILEIAAQIVKDIIYNLDDDKHGVIISLGNRNKTTSKGYKNFVVNTRIILKKLFSNLYIILYVVS